MGIDYADLHDPNAEYTMRDLSGDTMGVTGDRGTVVTLTFRGSEEPPSESAADPARRLAPKSVETD